MAAAAVLAREAKQQEALALVAHASSRNATLMRAQLALDAGDTGQVSRVVTDAMLACPTWGCLTFAPASQPTIVLTHQMKLLELSASMKLGASAGCLVTGKLRPSIRS